MSRKPSRIHLLGVVATAVVTVGVLSTLVPYCADNLLTPPLKGYNRVTGELFYYLVIGLLPVLVWLVPSPVRRLAYLTVGVHERFFGKSGFYIRFPLERSMRFRTMFIMTLGPFAVDTLAIVNLEYYFTNLHQSTAPGEHCGLAGSSIDGGGDCRVYSGSSAGRSAGLRLLRPRRGEVAPASAIFDGALGPLSMVAIMVSFVTTLQSASFSYYAGAFALGVWALRPFPPVLVAVSVYRLWVEPRVLPGLEAWLDGQGDQCEKGSGREA